MLFRIHKIPEDSRRFHKIAQVYLPLHATTISSSFSWTQAEVFWLQRMAATGAGVGLPTSASTCSKSSLTQGLTPVTSLAVLDSWLTKIFSFTCSELDTVGTAVDETEGTNRGSLGNVYIAGRRKQTNGRIEDLSVIDLMCTSKVEL